MISLGSSTGRSYPVAQFTSGYADIPQSAIAEAIENELQLHAEGRRSIGKNAYEKAFKLLEESVGRGIVTFSVMKDTETGVEQIAITLNSTSKVVVKIPVDAVVEIVHKAKTERVGWLLNTLA